MKKPTALVLAVLLLLSACTPKEEPKNRPSSTPEQTPVSEPARPDPTSKPTSEPIQDVSSKSIASFIQFKNEILNAGYSIDEEVRMGAELIGAVEGYKYKTSVGNIEIYQFDKNIYSVVLYIEKRRFTSVTFSDSFLSVLLPGDGFYTGAKQYSRPLFCQPEGLAPGKKYPMRHRIRFSQRHDPLRPVLL